MKPNALPPLADRYCTAINTLLRRELHAYTSELKKSAVARMATSPPEPDIVRGVKRVLLSVINMQSGTVLLFRATGPSAWLDQRCCVHEHQTDACVNMLRCALKHGHRGR